MGASRSRPKSVETVTLTDPPVFLPAPKPHPAEDEQRDEEEAEALHRTVNTTWVVPRTSGVRLPGAVDRDRVQHVAALPEPAGSR